METSKLNYISSDGVYTPVGNLSNVVQQLPPAVYEIRVVPMQGAKIFVRDNVDTSVPSHIYGKIPSYLKKSFDAFDRRQNNTGILLSGERGMGKSLFARMAINEALSRGMAVITVSDSSAVPLVSQITQPLLVVLDEFEKNFAKKPDDDDDASTEGAQTQFLSMLDGIGSANKRMFIATVNDTSKLSKYMLNRPGRFYYHFTFKSLSEAEIREYLDREANKASKKAIGMAVSVMQAYSINYDGIAAIAAELNAGNSIEDTLRDLNLDREGEKQHRLEIDINGYTYSDTVYYSYDEIRTFNSFNETLYYHGKNEWPNQATANSYLGPNIDVTFDGAKLTLAKDGSVIVPKSAISDIGLNYIKLEINGKETKHVSVRDLGKVSDIRIKTTRSHSMPLYMDV